MRVTKVAEDNFHKGAISPRVREGAKPLDRQKLFRRVVCPSVSCGLVIEYQQAHKLLLDLQEGSPGDEMGK